MSLRQFHYCWEWRLRSSPEALWPLVSDTNRFDRDAGLPPVERLSRPDASDPASAHRVRARIGGLRIEWDEFPFEWVRPHRFGVERRYLAGPIEHLRVLVELMPLDEGGTRLVYQVWSEPRNLLGSLLIPIQAGVIARKKFGRTFLRYDKIAALPQPAVQPVGKVHLGTGAIQRIEAATGAVQDQGSPRELADALAQAITKLDDMDLARMRPYAFADRWGAPRREVLALFLRATRAGLLDLQWDILCPMCRGGQASRSLGGVRQRMHCESCNIDFTVNFERSVELTFRPSPAVRKVNVHEYCIGGPRVTPHIVAQQLLESGTERELSPALEAGRHRLRIGSDPGGQLFIAAADGDNEQTFCAGADGWPDTEPRLSLKPRIRFVNGTGLQQLFIIERLAWSDQSATAAEVTALQVFRDLFATEALRAGEEISVGSVAVLFTDLRDSTRLYCDIGDAPAFGRVMNHFDVLREAVAAEDGALVKTIGDAVMAVFRRPLAALSAVLRAQRKLGESGDAPLTLKAGIHFGPCIAVTLNDRLDYFGSTVNLAARVQRFSEGGDVVISDAMRADHEVSEFLKGGNVCAESFAVAIRGFDNQHFDLWRIRKKL